MVTIGGHSPRITIVLSRMVSRQQERSQRPSNTRSRQGAVWPILCETCQGVIWRNLCPRVRRRWSQALSASEHSAGALLSSYPMGRGPRHSPSRNASAVPVVVKRDLRPSTDWSQLSPDRTSSDDRRNRRMVAAPRDTVTRGGPQARRVGRQRRFCGRHRTMRGSLCGTKPARSISSRPVTSTCRSYEPLGQLLAKAIAVGAARG
jgi:hypothetical protein